MRFPVAADTDTRVLVTNNVGDQQTRGRVSLMELITGLCLYTGGFENVDECFCETKLYIPTTGSTRLLRHEISGKCRVQG